MKIFHPINFSTISTRQLCSNLETLFSLGLQLSPFAMKSGHAITFYALTLVLITGLLSTAHAQCGRRACSSWRATRTFCERPSRARNCEMRRCGSGMWRCTSRATPSAVPVPSKTYLVAEITGPQRPGFLDTAINLLGAKAGPFCNGSPYITFDRERDGHFSIETYIVDISQALDQSGRSSLWMSFHAVQHSRFIYVDTVLTIYLRDEEGRRILSLSPVPIPTVIGLQRGCAFYMSATAKLRLFPTPQLNVTVRPRSNSLLLPNATVTTRDTRFKSAIEF